MTDSPPDSFSAEFDAATEKIMQEMDAFEDKIMRKSPDLCIAFTKLHFQTEQPSQEQTETMHAAIRLFFAENRRLPSPSVETDYDKVVEAIAENASFLTDLNARIDAASAGK